MLRDNCQATTTTAGGGPYTVDGLVEAKGVLPPAVLCTNGKKYLYKVELVGSDAFEVNEGTWTAGAPNGTFGRDRLLQSSTGAPIVWPDAAQKVITVVAASESFGPLGGAYRHALTTGTAAALAASIDIPVPILRDGL